MLHSPANKRSNIFPGDGCHRHWHGCWSGQPVGIIISGGEVADIVDIAEQEGHRTELAQAASSRAWGAGREDKVKYLLSNSLSVSV